jgi:Ca2+-transporting ATPase
MSAEFGRLGVIMEQHPMVNRLEVRQANGADSSKASPNDLPPTPWAMETEAVVEALASDPAAGLSPQEALRRIGRFGRNDLQRTRPRNAWAILLNQFRSIVVLLLCAAAAAAFWYGDVAESLAVGVVILINTLIGFFTELRATRSMEALRQLGRYMTRVRRDGELAEVPAEELVPGDIVILEGGDMITADLRLLQASVLQADESTLTGESTPVSKDTDALPESTALVERCNLLFKGTAVTRGAGTGIVIGTGQATELGRIAQLVRAAEAQETPLEKRLDALGRRLVWVMLCIAVLIAAAGVAAGRDTVLAIEVAVALMVAAIPEGLPIVATIALARGMWRMARRNVLIVRLSAVETLGATGIILTDKTGTLTENRMTVETLLLPGHCIQISGTGLETQGTLLEDGQVLSGAAQTMTRRLLQAAALCNDAGFAHDATGEATSAGDPTEVALLVAAVKFGIDPGALNQEQPRLREVPFDTDTKCMAVFHGVGTDITVSVKGAPEAVIPRCTGLYTGDSISPFAAGEAAEFLHAIEQLGDQGLRTLAVAMRHVDQETAEPYQDLVLLGAVGLLDPARAGVREAIERCQSAGIRVVMVTGDHIATARHIARDVHLLDPAADASACVDGSIGDTQVEVLARASVIARVSPQQKYDLIRHFQDTGHIVAMTGDGVNDAPALKQADIGVAMGVRGTAVAREAAAMVLQDDRFSSIVEAIAQGRAIFTNIRKFVLYLLSCNISEVLIVALATLAGAPLPLLPLQILFLNLVTDVFPALALGVGEGHAGQMQRPPRLASEGIICTRHWVRIALYGGVMSLSVLTAMGLARLALGLSSSQAVTVSFCTLALGQLWHVFNMRDARSHWLRNEITRNPWVWGAIVLCLGLVLFAVYLPGVSDVLELQAPPVSGWLLILGMSLLPLLAAPLVFRLTPDRAVEDTRSTRV